MFVGSIDENGRNFSMTAAGPFYAPLEYTLGGNPALLSALSQHWGIKPVWPGSNPREAMQPLKSAFRTRLVSGRGGASACPVQ